MKSTKSPRKRAGKAGQDKADIDVMRQFTREIDELSLNEDDLGRRLRELKRRARAGESLQSMRKETAAIFAAMGLAD